MLFGVSEHKKDEEKKNRNGRKSGYLNLLSVSYLSHAHPDAEKKHGSLPWVESVYHNNEASSTAHGIPWHFILLRRRHYPKRNRWRKQRPKGKKKGRHMCL